MEERRVAVPFRRPLAGETVRRATLLRGQAGWGEYSPVPGYPCDPALARAAAEEAACDGWPAALRASVPVNALVPAVGAEEAGALSARAVADGFHAVKVKVGATGADGVDSDVDRVAAVRDAVGAGVALRVDANGGWDVDTAVSAVRRMAAYDLELVEQPAATLDELAAVRRQVEVRIVADESVRSLADATRLKELGAADAVMLKVQPLGGAVAALRVAEAAGVPAIVSSMFETSVGLAAGLALAAALPELPFACGLATAEILAGDVVADPLVAIAGVMEVRRPEPDPALLDRYEDRD